MSGYSAHVSARTTPQSEPIFGRDDQVENSAGGFVFSITPWKQLERFLILGCEGGTYYASERALTVENARVVLECLASDPKRTVDTIVSISQSGRAPRNSAAVFAAALVATSQLPSPRFDLSLICRTASDMFAFVRDCKAIRGITSRVKGIVREWYGSMDDDRLAYQVSKYQKRYGWTHRDVMRQVHPAQGSPALSWAAGQPVRSDWPRILVGMHLANLSERADEVASLIGEYSLVREHIPTKWLADPLVLEALLEKMPATAMIRNLGSMASRGLLAPLSRSERTVRNKLADADWLKASRIHPFALLLAHEAYRNGAGLRGKLTWPVNQEIVASLADAFYAAFDNITPTGLRHMVAIDVSYSMQCAAVSGTAMRCNVAAAAMAMSVVRSEQNVLCVGFSSDLVEIPINRRSSLGEVVDAMGRIPMGGTDCSAPMRFALTHKIPVDVFVIYTDNETWCGQEHPVQSLEKYRRAMNPRAKLVVCAMTATGFSIADPNDAGMLDVVGMDSSTPIVIADFCGTPSERLQ